MSDSMASPKEANAQLPYTLLRNKHTGAIDAVVLQRAPAKPLASQAKESNELSAQRQLVIPLRHLLQKIVRISRTDDEVPIGFLYAHLGRLRSLLTEATDLHNLSDGELASNPARADRFQRFIETLTSLGYAPSASGRTHVHFEGVAEIISLLEAEYATVIEEGRAARANANVTVEYMALQELYRPGDVVTTRQMGDLGGTLLGLRVIDCYYESIKSILGARKYSFHLVLETIVALAGEFVAAPFEFIFEDWDAGKEQSNLPFQLLRPDTNVAAVEELCTRAKILAQVNKSTHSYQHYSAGCFFPHRSKGDSLGSASSAERTASAGRLIVDTARGLKLGHAPVAAVDEVGMAIAQTSRGLRNVQRAVQDADAQKQRSDRLVAAGLRVWSKLPKEFELVAWPTVVAFSLNIKQWGHVLVDGLSPVLPSQEAWDQLVLPPKTKEMLSAMAISMRSPSNPPRYQFRDLVDSRGGGVLFLLYGPPGTGKTLSVEALASRFGCPLYSLSFAELGSSVAQLEERLTDVLALAAEWGALVLLDEGDALVERRQRGQLMLNSMTGVLLRLLETFDGALFITSNRAASFDPAALSRVTLAIRYEPLDVAGRREIWTNTLSRVLADERGPDGGRLQRSREEVALLVRSSFDLDRLARFEGSGRAVGSIMRLAIGLCQQRQCELTQQVLTDAMEVWEDFSKELQGAGVHNTWDE